MRRIVISLAASHSNCSITCLATIHSAKFYCAKPQSLAVQMKTYHPPPKRSVRSGIITTKKTSLRGRSLPGERAIHFSLFLYHVRAFAFNDRGEGRENTNANGQTALAVMMVVLYPKITSRDQDAPQSYSRSCPRVLVRCDHAERFFLPLVRGKFIFVMISWCQSCEVQASQRVFTSEFSERPIRVSRAVFANKGADAISIRPDVIVQKIGA